MTSAVAGRCLDPGDVLGKCEATVRNAHSSRKASSIIPKAILSKSCAGSSQMENVMVFQ